MASEIRAALRDALATYLTSRLASQFPADAEDADGLKVYPRRRPLGTMAVQKVIAVATQPGSVDVQSFPPTPISVADTSGTSSLVTYAYGYAEVPMQLDVWAPNEPTRDALVQAVEAAINRPPAATLLGATSEFARFRGVVIRVTDFYDAPSRYLFGSFPRAYEETSASSQGSRWRATWQGTAQLYLLDQQTLNLLKTLVLQEGVNGAARTNRQLLP